MTNYEHPLEIVHNQARTRFEIDLEGQLGTVDYYIEDGHMIITHSGVPAQFEGQGIAAAMNRAAFEYARESGYKVVPACPYTAAFARRHKEFHDIVAHDEA